MEERPEKDSDFCPGCCAEQDAGLQKTAKLEDGDRQSPCL